MRIAFSLGHNHSKVKVVKDRVIIERLFQNLVVAKDWQSMTGHAINRLNTETKFCIWQIDQHVLLCFRAVHNREKT